MDWNELTELITKEVTELAKQSKYSRAAYLVKLRAWIEQEICLNNNAIRLILERENELRPILKRYK